jgi:hypothetical protein
MTVLFAVNPRAKLQSPIESTARALLLNFVAGRFDAATRDFNDQLRPIATPLLLAETKERLDHDAGAFQSVSEVRRRTEDGFRVIELIAKFATSSVSVRVVFDLNDRVGAVYFNPILPPAADPVLEGIARELLASVIGGNFDRATNHFDVTMRAQFTPESFSALRKNIADLYGTFKSVTEVHQRNEKPFRVIDVIAAYDKMPLALRVAFDSRGSVVALHISPYRGESSQ